MKNRLIPLVLLAALVVSLLSGCGASGASAPTGSNENATVTFQGDQVSITGTGAVLDDGEVVIAQGGTYVLSGEGHDTRVIVKAGEADDVTLVLRNLNLTNPDDEAIYFKTCGSAIVILEDGTENVLFSGKDPQAETDEDDLTITDEGETPSGAALRAKCDLTISGGGALTVAGYINNGIKSNGDLVILGGILDVTAVNDGIKSDGNITVYGGDFTVYAEHDGFSAGQALTIHDGDFDVSTGVGSAEADMKVSDSLMMGDMGNMGGGPGGDRDRASQEASGESSDEADTATDEAAAENAEPQNDTTDDGDRSASRESSDRDGSREMMPMPGGDWMDSFDADDTGSDSRKGMKAGETIAILGGRIAIDAEDDAIHSDGIVAISGGELTLASGDDGIRGEDELVVSGGTIYVTYCYEGLEATSILLTGGYTNVTAVDDGLNATGGGMMFGPSQEASGESSETSNPVVRITGGTLIVDSGGDGLDSNGSLYIEGGVIFVSGPSTDWDSPIDYGEGSSEFVISGGFLMAAGYSGMFESPDTTEDSQASIYYVLDDYVPDGALTTLKAADGTVLAEYTFNHSYNAVLLSTPEMAAGETYTLTVDGETETIEMTSAQYSSRGSSFEMGGGPGGGPGGGGGGGGMRR